MKRYWVVYIWAGRVVTHALSTDFKSAYRYCMELRHKGYISYIKIVECVEDIV